MFSIVERSHNYVFGDEIIPPPPRDPGERASSCKICPLFTCRICYCEVSTLSRGRGKRNFCGGIFYGNNFPLERKFLCVSFQRQFARIPIVNLFYSSYFLFYDSIVHGKIFWGNFHQGWNHSGDFSMQGISAEEILHGEIPPGSVLHGEIFRGRNFPLCGGSGKKLPHRGISVAD